MRLNKYTLTIENGESTILYNLITKVLIEVNCKKEEIQNKFIDQLSDDDRNFYRDRLLISSDGNDDIQEMMEIKDNFNNQEDIARFMIHLGYACNLSCSYCYQSTIDEEYKNFRIDTESIVGFIHKVALKYNFTAFDICFMGGEPFLYWQQMINIMEELNVLLEGKSIFYSTVTNGTLLNSEHGLDELINLGLKVFQITLDGTKKYHDFFRKKGNKGSFDTIIKNLKHIAKLHSDVSISINYNLSNFNSNGISDLFKFLRDNNLKFPLVFSMVFDNGKNIPMECNPENSLWRDAHSIGIKYGQSYEPFYRDLYLGCALTQRNYFIIGADGNLYKCINAVNNKNYLLTHIQDYDSIRYREKLKNFLEYEPKETECKTCELFPICYGGCEYRNQISGFHCEKAQFYANDIPLIKEMVNAGNQRLEEEL